MSVSEIARRRQCGVLHFHCIFGYPEDPAEILARCGLTAQPTQVRELSRAQAVSLLTRILHQEPAHETQLMYLDEARRLAESFFEEASDATSRYFTAEGNLTSSVWDYGILIAAGQANDTRHTCLWIEDED